MSEQHDGREPHPGIEEDTGLSYYARRAKAIEDLLVAKGICTSEEVQRRVNQMEARSPSDGAKVVARAWVDPEYKARLLANPPAALEDLFVSIVSTSEDLHLESSGRREVEVRLEQPLEGRNHLILEDEPAWPRFMEEIRNFLSAAE